MSKKIVNLKEPLKFNEMCRICLGTAELKPLMTISIIKTLTIYDLLKNSLFIELAENKTPAMVCKKCEMEIIQIYNFRKMCIASERTWKSITKELDMFKFQTIQQQPQKRLNWAQEREDVDEERCLSRNKLKINEEQEKGKQQSMNEINANIENIVDNQSINLLSKKIMESEPFVQTNANLQYECKMCNIAFATKQLFLEHRKQMKHPTKRIYCCKICSKLMLGGEVRLHMQLHRVQTFHSCEICDRKFNSVGNLRRHIRSHLGEKLYKCTICDKSFTRLMTLTLHQQRHHDNTSIHSTTSVCEFCNKTFLNANKMRLHQMKMHNEPNGNKCIVCNQLFNNADVLLQHLHMEHGQNSELVCKTCDKTFQNVRLFLMHMKKQHGDMNMKKGIGFQNFISDVIEEDNVLQNEEGHMCELCNEQFDSIEHFKYHHLTKHTTKISFMCEICEHTYPTIDAVNEHRKLEHSGTSYTCGVCSKTFMDYMECKQHLELHDDTTTATTTITAIEYYDCKMCDELFETEFTLQQHLEMHHDENMKIFNEI